MFINVSRIVNEARKVIENCNSRDPYVIADKLGIEIVEREFKHQLGAYKPVLGIPFIFIKSDVDSNFKKIILLHEIGHHILHKEEAEKSGVILESSLFNLSNKMEYEANIFCSEISILNDEILEFIEMGFDVDQIANALNSNRNLVALKIDTLNQQGHKFQKQFFNKKFLN